MKIRIVVAALAACCLMGCAIGKDGAGSYVLGFPFGGASPESAGEVASTIGTTIGTMLGGPAGGALGNAASVVLASVFGWGGYKLATSRHRAADIAFDEGVARSLPTPWMASPGNITVPFAPPVVVGPSK